MKTKLEFTNQKQTLEFSTAELHDLQKAVAYALNGGGRIALRNFGQIRVLGSGTHQAFNNQQQNTTPVQTDC